ncbi:hypothetical protein [Pseudothauera rhizosphaerae]|uniref:Uncharacterized protein n=1 Tax=Pseudothauera rhizosphaerae TaxID=2565932 RepID=A0A4S4B0E9_9RHOO|nr:hypothetical protein [Pseudothauera rhizosphaerae]THF64335.1 hypothetical protein E6O51_03220 [Pseudothauera rhizosphaerae]
MRRGSKHGIDWREYLSRVHEFTKRGEDLPQSKLNAEIVRKLRETTWVIPAHEWARRLGVSKSAIERARQGETWRHVV